MAEAARVPAVPARRVAALIVATATVVLWVTVPTLAKTTSNACPAGEVATQGFIDVSATDAHRPAVDCVAWWSVAQGSTSTTFRPGDAVTRAQMATFVARLMSAGGYELPAEPANAFSDDHGDTHETAINQLAAAGIVGGTGGGRYSPAAAVTREQMATFLVRAYAATTGIEPTATADRFTDDAASAHEESINIAASLGIASGTSATTYAPTRSVVRNQMATFVARVLDLFVQADLATPPASRFGDGRWRVPDQMPPGLYRNSDSSQSCYWERATTTPSPDVDGTVAALGGYGLMIVRVMPTDTSFTSQNCGTWSTDLSPRTTSTIAPFGAGHYQVGSEIAAGVWRNSETLGCEWQRLSGYSAEEPDIIEDGFNEIVEVTIAETDVGFYSNFCGTWTYLAPGGGEGDEDDADGGDDEADCFGCVTLTEVVGEIRPSLSLPTSMEHCVNWGTTDLAGGQVIGANVPADARTFTYTVNVTILGTPECNSYKAGFGQEETVMVYDFSVRVAVGAGAINVRSATPALYTELPKGATTPVTVTFEVPEGNYYNGPLTFQIIIPW